MTQRMYESFENLVKREMYVFSVQLRDVGLSFPSVKEAAVGAETVRHESQGFQKQERKCSLSHCQLEMYFNWLPLPTR